MSLLRRVIQRARRDYFQAQYRKLARQVLVTQPVLPGKLPFMLLSMVQRRDIHSYLVAVKSFTHFADPQRIVVICDPSITDADRAILSEHIPHVELLDAHGFTHPDIPRGGTWERLFAIAGFSTEQYVVQLDADTLTVQPIPEVLEAIATGRGFVLGEMPDTPFRSLSATREYALPWKEPGAHVQCLAETEIVHVGLPEHVRYIRGCSGFTGFPRSADMRQRMTDFSQRMGARLGEDWKRWGTEQVTSNFLVANLPCTIALPFPKYGTPDCATKETAFYHFIGSLRFDNNKYEAISQQALRLFNMSSPEPGPASMDF